MITLYEWELSATPLFGFRIVASPRDQVVLVFVIEDIACVDVIFDDDLSAAVT
jgi:hypothetical protein